MSSSELPVWFVPLLVLGLPIAFVAIWSLVCALIAAMSGYRSLAPFRIDRTAAIEGEMLPTPPIAFIGVSRYRGGILKLYASPGGLALQISRIFVFHPPVRLPWGLIREDAVPGFFGPALRLDDRVRLSVSPEIFAAIRDAKARYAA